MKLKKLLNKYKSSLLCCVIAFAMLFSVNYSFIYSVSTYSNFKFANAVYNAEVFHSYNFDSSSYFGSYSSGSSSTHTANRNTSLVDLKLDNNFYPISKYNGVSTITSERDQIDNLATIDKADNYAAVLSTKNEPAARKVYTTNSDGKNQYETTNDKNLIYVSTTKKSSETEDEHKTRIATLKEQLSQLNTELGDAIYVCVDQYEDSYDASDYSNINSETEEYKAITEDFKKLTSNDEPVLNVTDYKYSNKRVFEYTENYLYFRTNSTISFTNNNYYVVSCWIYTAGDATATLAIEGTNLSAKIENISTGGRWVKYNLFIESRAAVSTSVYTYLYYGDSNGITGLNTLDSYKDTYDNGQDNYSTNTLNGTVAFDQLTIHTINAEEYSNQTINGYTTADIANASLAEGYSIDGAQVNGQPTTKIVNSKKANKAEDDVITYDKVYYDSAPIINLNYNYTYSARYYTENSFNSTNNFDANFQSSADKQLNDLVYSYDNATNLLYNTYESNNSNMFSYYLPRYTTDSGTTKLSSRQQEIYRNMYNNNSLNLSVVPEVSEFEEYDRDIYDEFGNKVTETDEDGKEVTKTEKVHNNTFNANNQILKVTNTNQTYDLGVVTADILIKQHSYYRISVWAYSATKTDIATAKLFSTIKTNSATENGTLILSSQTATDWEYNGTSNNGWKELVFFVQGNAYHDCTANLALLASPDSVIYYDTISIESVSSSSYTSASTKLDLAKTGAVNANITNGNFNNITVSGEDNSYNYPYTAASWTLDDSNSDNVVSGIVNTSETKYQNLVVPAYKDGSLYYYEDNEIIVENGKVYKVEKTGNEGSTKTEIFYGEDYFTDYKGKYIHTTTIKNIFGNQNAPVTTIAEQTLPDTNVYAVNIPAQTSEDASAESEGGNFLMTSANIGKTSASSSLDANAVYAITMQVWFGTDFSGTFVSNLMYNKSNISAIEYKVDNTSGPQVSGWQTFTFYVRTGNSSRSSISLQLGAKDSTGTFFVQNVTHTSLSEKNNNGLTVSIDDQFETLVKNNVDFQDNSKVKYVDLKNDNFTMHSNDKNDESIYQSYSYKLPTLDEDKEYDYTQGSIGVINTDDSFKFNEETIIGNLINTNSSTQSALLLKNEKTTDYTSAESVFSTTLSSSEYYKVTFAVKTSDLNNNGLKVTVKGISESFENINTSSVTENNGWSTYTIYVRTGSSSINSFALNFSLGTDDGKSFTGWALVSDIQINQIEQKLYEEETTTDEIKNDSKVIIKSLYTEQESKDETSASSFKWSTFFLVLSSVLLVLSLIMALVATIIKNKAQKSGTDKPTLPDAGISTNSTTSAAPVQGGIV